MLGLFVLSVCFVAAVFFFHDFVIDFLFFLISAFVFDCRLLSVARCLIAFCMRSPVADMLIRFVANILISYVFYLDVCALPCIK